MLGQMRRQKADRSTSDNPRPGTHGPPSSRVWFSEQRSTIVRRRTSTSATWTRLKLWNWHGQAIRLGVGVAGMFTGQPSRSCFRVVSWVRRREAMERRAATLLHWLVESYNSCDSPNPISVSRTYTYLWRTNSASLDPKGLTVARELRKCNCHCLPAIILTTETAKKQLQHHWSHYKYNIGRFPQHFALYISNCHDLVGIRIALYQLTYNISGVICFFVWSETCGVCAICYRCSPPPPPPPLEPY